MSHRPIKTYTFNNNIVDTWFQPLENSGKFKLLEIRHPDEVGNVRDPNYCKQHKMLGYPTKSYYHSKIFFKPW